MREYALSLHLDGDGDDDNDDIYSGRIKTIQEYPLITRNSVSVFGSWLGLGKDEWKIFSK